MLNGDTHQVADVPQCYIAIYMFQDKRSSFLKHSKNNHLQYYIISKSDNNNNNNNKQDLKAPRNGIIVLNQILISKNTGKTK